MQRCERNGDVLKWWKENSVILPALSGIAKAVLCVPAGSVASEQLFSIRYCEKGKFKCRNFRVADFVKSQSFDIRRVEVDKPK